MKIICQVVPMVGMPFDVEPESDVVIIGRSSGAGIVVSDRSMSRRHAKLVRDGDGWLIEDLGSRNGTLLDGRRINGATPIAPGSTLKIGSTTINIGAAAKTRQQSVDSALSGHTVFRSAAELLEEPEAVSSGALRVPDDPLRRYTEKLKLLNEVHQSLDRALPLEDLLELILDRAFESLRPEEGTIFLKGENGEFFRAATRSVKPGGSETLYSSNLMQEVVDKGQAALVLDTAVDERFNQAMSLLDAGVRSLVAAPLLDPSGALGLIVLGSTLGIRRFTEDDMELLTSLASVAAMRIRNTRLSEEALERERLERDVALARHIQVGLLPKALPEIEGWRLIADNIPSRGVSGDFYKVEGIDDGSCAFMVADVSGKGIAASLLTASLEALAAGPIHDAESPEQICDRVSHLLFERTPPEKFATCFLASLDPTSGVLRYSNAGHNPGIVLRSDGTVEWLASTGMPLGILPEASYESSEVIVETGDAVVLYTDGLTEAENPEGEEYGEARLADLCRRHRNESLERLARIIARDQEEFVRGVPFVDDRTLVMMRRT
ncbi:MAG: SpoIIE family protein phosphatase [Thermoanaerobaculales bacterium]|nr:SpoIIE family protein phosphatase [Thermoanaerobaculales bacterium]